MSGNEKIKTHKLDDKSDQTQKKKKCITFHSVRSIAAEAERREIDIPLLFVDLRPNFG